MGNCNCIKQSQNNSIFSNDVKVEDLGNKYRSNIIHSKSPMFEKKISSRGVRNPIQKIKKDNSLDNNLYNLKEDLVVDKKNKNSSTEKYNQYSITLKNFDSVEGNLETAELEASKTDPKLIKKLTDIINAKRLKKLEKNRNSINIVLLGDRCVGKSNIIFQYTSNKFDQYYITTIYKEEFSKTVTFGNKKYNLYFTVTSGDPQYQGDYTNIYKSCDFFVLVFDLTVIQSFEKIKEILNNEIIQYFNLYRDNCSNVIVVGNKADLKSRRVSYDQVASFFSKYFIEYFEVSAKNNTNLGKVFNKITEIYDNLL